MTNNSSLEIKSDFRIAITMDSDWHIGSGTGRRGDIDRLVKRDRNGLPYLPAKTITGIWRDACELLATGLDEGTVIDEDTKKGYFSQLVDYLFGDQPALAEGAIATSPREAALSVRAAHFPEALSNALKDKPILKEAISFVKVGVTIDVNNGCAIEDNLRFEEVVRGGITLTSDCQLKLPVESELQKLCFALIVASTKFFEKIGGKRRRGNGHCSVKIESVPIDEWITWLGEYLSSDQLSLPKIPELNIDKNESQEGDLIKGKENSWQTIRLQIEAISPIVISQRTVGNVVETLDYIPGTHLLRMVRRQLVKHNPELALSIDTAIAHNDMVVTNATIAIGDRQSYPTPFILAGEKMGGGIAKSAKIYNRFADQSPKDIQLKSERGGYLACAIADGKPTYPIYQTVGITAETHNIVEDAVQRPTEKTGGVYTYEAIAAGTVFQAEVRLHKHIANSIAQTQDRWQKILGGETAIGQSKKDDYGRVSVTVLELENQISFSSTTANTLAVWLLSDVLLRDERLRPTTDPEYLRAEIQKHLGIELKLFDSDKPKSQEESSISLLTRSHRIDSWQVRWQKPRPSLVGIGAGSCLHFEIPSGVVTEEKIRKMKKSLTEIERSGIGERRAEGYGQVCFNHPLLSQPLSELKLTKTDNISDVESVSPLIPEHPYARTIERAAWQKAIQQKVLAKAEDRKTLLYIGVEKDKPRMSQLGALRSVLSNLQSFSDAPQAIRWLNHLEERRNRCEKWHPESLEKIKKYLTKENLIWIDLELYIAPPSKTETGTSADFDKEKWAEELRKWAEELRKLVAPITLTETGADILKQELWAEALYALVDACIRAHKRELESKSPQE